jgi:hypothetical protein
MSQLLENIDNLIEEMPFSSDILPAGGMDGSWWGVFKSIFGSELAISLAPKAIAAFIIWLIIFKGTEIPGAVYRYIKDRKTAKQWRSEKDHAFDQLDRIEGQLNSQHSRIADAIRNTMNEVDVEVNKRYPQR